MAKISRDEVAHVAKLARLELTEDDLERFTEQLAAVLQHAEDVEALELDDVPPTAHPFPIANVLRPDEPRECAIRDEVLAAAPAAEDNMFKVPAILGDAP